MHDPVSFLKGLEFKRVLAAKRGSTHGRDSNRTDVPIFKLPQAFLGLFSKCNEIKEKEI